MLKNSSNSGDNSLLVPSIAYTLLKMIITGTLFCQLSYKMGYCFPLLKDSLIIVGPILSHCLSVYCWKCDHNSIPICISLKSSPQATRGNGIEIYAKLINVFAILFNAFTKSIVHYMNDARTEI